MSDNQDEMDFVEDAGEDISELNSVWDLLTPEQKKYFRKLSEKTPDKMKYIG